MAISNHADFNGFLKCVKRRNPHHPEFVEAVQEVADAVLAFGVV